MPDHASLGSTIVLEGGGGSVPERALALYVVGISLGGWQYMYTERLVDSVVGRARDCMTISCIANARGDPRAYRWRPREVTRGRQSMLRC